MRTWLAAGAACVLLLALSAFLLTSEAPFALLFGWIGFLRRVLPRVTADWPSVAVGGVAAALFILGVHWIGRARRRSVPAGDRPAGRTWKFRWSLAAAAAVFLLFAAGIAVVGAVHQVIFLLASDRPFVGEAMKGRPLGSANNLRSVGIALASYGEANGGTLPPGGTFTPEGDMRHSWETHLLPYLGYSTRGIDQGRAWNDPVNQPYFKCVVPDFVNPDLRVPSLTDGEGYGLSHYAANSRVMSGNRSLKVADLGQGASNTLVVGEVNARLQPWGHPANWRDPVRGIDRSPAGFGGPAGSGGANFVMADGSVRFVSDRISPEALRALSTPGGRE